MRPRLDAWLERKDPRMRLFDADTGLDILRLGPDQVRELIDSGVFCPHDLAHSSAHCAELILQLEDLSAGRRDPTRLRVPSYLGRS